MRIGNCRQGASHNCSMEGREKGEYKIWWWLQTDNGLVDLELYKSDKHKGDHSGKMWWSYFFVTW